MTATALSPRPLVVPVNATAIASETQVRALRDDASAIDAIMSLWRRPLYAFAWRYLHNQADAEDLVIETFVRLHQQRHRLRDDTHLSAWLFTTLANLCHNQHRWRRRHPEATLDLATADATLAAQPSSPTPPVQLEEEETGALVRAAVDELPHDQKTVVLLYHYEHLSYRDISTIVGCSERGVETRLYRARFALRAALKPLLGELGASPEPRG